MCPDCPGQPWGTLSRPTMSVNPAGPSRSLWLGVSSRHRMSRCFFIVVTILAVAAASSISQGASAASATVLQDEQLPDRPVSSIDFEGLEDYLSVPPVDVIRQVCSSVCACACACAFVCVVCVGTSLDAIRQIRNSHSEYCCWCG